MQKCKRQNYTSKISQSAMKKVRKFFGQFDMFSASPTLRAKQQQYSSSLCSGILSFMIALFFSYVFINSAVEVFTHQNIQSVQMQSKLSGKQVKSEPLFFAVRVGYLSASESKLYFDIQYTITTETGETLTNELIPCTSDQWKKIGDNYLDQFDQYQISQFFCPHQQDNLTLSKVYYAENSRYIQIGIKPCVGINGCKSQSQHRQFVQNVTDKQGAVFLLVYFLDTVINPSSDNPIKYTINTDVELAFTTLRGIIATVQFGSYQINTDEGITPVQQIKTIQGNFVNSFRQTSIEIKSLETNYALVYLQMNRKFIQIDRVVGKIDVMLSYAGGLFSILIGFLAIFINSFNQYRYELMVAQGIFHEDQQGNIIRQHDFTFFKYVKYTIFDWIQILFCIKVQWKDCMLIDDTREQSNCQLDVTRLFRKIQAMECTLLHIIDKAEKDCLYLVKPETLGSIRKNRLFLQYYQAIVQGKQALTIQQYVISNKILKFGLSLIQQNGDSFAKNQNSMNKIDNQFNYQPSQSISFQDMKDQGNFFKIVLTKFPHIAEQAKQIKLSQQLLQVQIDLAEQFCDIKDEARIKIQKKIPIIILHRLAAHVDFQALASKQKKRQNDFESKSDNLGMIIKKRYRNQDKPLQLIQFDRAYSQV